MNIRYCQVRGHEDNNTTYICTYKDCYIDTRWVCVDCIFSMIHDHGQPLQNHLMKKQQFLDFIKQQVQLIYDQKKIYKMHIENCIKKMQYVINSTQLIIQQLQKDLAAIQKTYNLEEIKQIIDLTNNNHLLLNKQQIEKIVNLNYDKKHEYNLSSDFLTKLKNHHEEFQKSLENNGYEQNSLIKQEIGTDIQLQTNTQQTYKTYIGSKLGSMICSSQISYDEKYLVIGKIDSKIQIYDFATKKKIKSICDNMSKSKNNSIQMADSVITIKFTKDSKYLICGYSNGYLLCFDTNNFSQNYKNQIHQRCIRDILPIDNNQIITCSDDKSIIITNMTEKNQQLIKDAHNDPINTIDYDQLKNVIVSGSEDNSIKIFNKTNGVLLFQQKTAHDDSVKQIQLIDKMKNILSSGSNNLIQWFIDYDKKQLIRIKVLDQCHYNFTSVATDNRIILICDQVVKILDKNLKEVQQINHDLELSNYNIARQLNSMNYIIVRETDYQRNLFSIQVLRRE